MSERLDKTIAVGLLVTVVFTALAHGAVESWSLALYELIITLLLLMWAIKSILDRKLKITIPAIAWPIFALLVIGAAQSISIGGPDTEIRSLSMDVEATRATVTVLFFLLMSFLIAANFLDSRERFQTLIRFVVVYGLVLAVFALIQHLTWDGRFYWFRPTRVYAVFGPFANRNHYAGYMAMLIPVPVGLILSRAVPKEAWLLFGFGAAIMGLTVVVSLSRGGMVSVFAGLMFVAVMSGRQALARGGARVRRSAGGRSRSQAMVRTGAVVAIAIAIAVGVFWIGAEGVINRAAQSIDEQSAPSQMRFFGREWVWRDTLTMFSNHPIIGAGLGAYETVYPMYTHSNGYMVVQYAHNDYLQLLSDAGIVGGVAGIWFLVLLFRAIARGTRSADPLLAGLAVGCGGGIFAILVHSLFDFNLQIPSNCLLFLLLAAVVSNIAATVDEVAPAVALKERAAAEAGKLATGVPS
ncbi:MAG: O-antigen ligase family protein [Acidobacteriota bacterium]